MSPKRRPTPDPTPSSPAAGPPEGARDTSEPAGTGPSTAAGSATDAAPDAPTTTANEPERREPELGEQAAPGEAGVDGGAGAADDPLPDPETLPETDTLAEGDDAATDADGDGGRRRAKKPDGGGPPPPPERLEGAVEALLLAAGEALTAERVRDLLGLPSALHVREAVEAIRTRWKAAGLAVEIQDVAGGHRVVTRPEYAEYVRRLWRRPAADRLSATLLETLSIVAYKQPVARAEIERIRGVQCGEALRQLLERRLLKVSGRSDQPGRPLLYATTVRFLEVFGLAGLEDLPNAKDLARL
ncbi:MAG: SMC-Scp complex subunit ScpB [Planctomycetia bacterium]|nr:SMC-Scp complex subunit ScpB [Planctomycetia bacterium]